MCNTLEYIAQLLRVAPPVENFRQFSYCLFSISIFSLHLPQPICGHHCRWTRGTTEAVGIAPGLQPFRFPVFLTFRKTSKFSHTIFTRRSRFKKEQNNGKRNAGLPKYDKLYYFYCDRACAYNVFYSGCLGFPKSN